MGLQLPAPLSSLSALALKFLIGTFPVPPFLLPIYQAAGIDYGVPWEVLASINEVETDYGRDLATSSAGAVGWMQFLPSTWERYGINADAGAGANPYDPIDAIFAAARYLHAAGAEANLSGAIFAYNHAGWYVNSVELRANVLQLLPRGLIDGLTGLMQASFPVAGHLGRYATMKPTPVALAGQPAVALGGPAGAPVIAAADGRVVAIGDDADRGRYVTIEDSYGDRFTYARLGSVASVYPVLTPRVESATRLADELGLRPPARGTRIPAASSSTTTLPSASAAAGAGRGHGRAGGAAAPAPTSGPSSSATAKERLFAHPSRTASYVSGGQLQLQSSLRSYAAASDLQVGGSGPSDYFSETAQLKPGDFTLAPLQPGATVVTGTIVGRIARAPQGASGVVLQIRPAGARAPVEPSPIVAGWELLGRLTAGRPALAGAGQSGAYGSRNPSLGQLLLASKRDLEQAVLTDPRLTISGCDRQAVQAGLVDWRVLAAIEYLSYSGLAPTISGLVCGQPGIPSQAGTRVEISSLDGTPVAGNEQDGGVVDLAIRALLALQGSLRPSRIVSLRSYPWQANTIALPDHAATVEIDFPTSPSTASLGGELNTAQWQRLIERLTQLGAPANGSGAASPTALGPPPAVTPPAVTPPTVTTPTVTTPTVTTPTVTTPTVTTPTVTTPAVTTPTVTTPAVTTPTATTPAVTTPVVPPPAVTTPSVTPPALTTPLTTVLPSTHPVRRRTAARGFSVPGVGCPGTATATAPSVFLNVPPSPLAGTNVPLSAFATPTKGATIASVCFEISPAGQNQWTMIAQPVTSPPYTTVLDTTDPTLAPQNGPYDIMAVATDGAGNTGAALVQNRVVADNATFLTVTPIGSPVHGTVTLTSIPEAGGFQPDTETFETCPVTANCFANPSSWTPLPAVGPELDPSGNPVTDPNGSQIYTTPLDTTALADGSYNLEVTGQDAGGNPYTGDVIGNLTVDNTPPTNVSLSSPGGSLTGTVPLSASAQDAGSGVASVKFEVSPAGAGTWTTIGVATSAPYSASFDTAQLANGSYDLRVEATDAAGNTAASPVVAGVTISNAPAQNFGNLTLTNYVAPATNIQLLGEIAGSPVHETWAVGQTNAPPPPALAGAYTAQGQGQEVLLEYTDPTGWQIADVLRNTNGTPFPLNPTHPPQIVGQMATNGEAWITLSQQNPLSQQQQTAVFHRLPGGQFLLDSNASGVLGPLISGGQQVRLGVAGGTTYGVVVPAQGPPFTTLQANSPTGMENVGARIEYSELLPNGTWTPPQGNTLPLSYSAPANTPSLSLTLEAADPTGPGTGWAVLDQFAQGRDSLILASFDTSGWHFVGNIGLDALDLTDEFSGGSQESASAAAAGGFAATVKPIEIRADSGGVFVSAAVSPGNAQVIARYDFATKSVTESWCSSRIPRTSFGCAQPLDVSHPAAVPDAVFNTAQGIVDVALSTTSNFLDVYSHGAWTSVPTPGFGGFGSGGDEFVDPTDGWLVGPNALARVSAAPSSSALASWPEPNRLPLLGVALPPGQSTTATPGALAVGADGTALHYDVTAGWQVDPTPPRAHHVELTGVAFAGPAQAFAVGQDGTILDWNGTAWSEDPQSVSLTTATLNAVAFDTGGQGWAVGSNGTIIHYDGTSWSAEQVDPQDSGKDITSVAVAGQTVYAIAGGNLIVRGSGGTWQRVGPASLPTPTPPVGALTLVSGLPDGGLAVGGKSMLLEQQSPSSGLQYAAQSFQGIPVALAAFRDAGGTLRAFVSEAPPVEALNGLTTNTGGFPAGDGDLIVQTSSGWQDLSRSQYPTETYAALGDGVVQPDPVLAVAASSDGSHAWAVGGYSGTHAADGIGTDVILAARPAGWLASSIWRYDAGGTVQSQTVAQTTPSLPASPGTVSFAFFSSALCKIECAAVQNAQPSVNLSAAAGEIAAFARQPGGPAFAMLGGNAIGRDPVDLASLPGLLSPLASLPTYAAFGPEDSVQTASNPDLPWAQDFARAPAPFGSGAAPAGFTPQGSGDPTGPVNKYYAFDARRNGGTLRVIVLDNSAGSLDASAPGQSAWLTAQLAQAQAAGLPIVVFAAEPLAGTDIGAATDGDAVATQLAAAGVLGVFTTSGGLTAASESDRVVQIPANAAIGAPQIPEYEGATLTYQQPQNNGVTWYDVSVNTATSQLTVNAIPVARSLTLEPLAGLSVVRSSTLSFQAIARRPPSTIATTPADPTFPGYDQYVSIPSSTCGGCIGPSYAFTSSNPIVGNFVVPSSPGSPYPKLSSTGKTTASSKSGLFCAFNSGTTTVSVTAGLLTSSLPVTVSPGAGFGPPCGTVAGGQSTQTIHIVGPTRVVEGSNPGLGVGTAPPTGTQPTFVLPKILLPPALPVLTPAPRPIPPVPRIVISPPPPPPAPFVVPPAPPVPVTPVVPPLIPAAITPVPPGGATVSAQAAARREEKARKHAQQSAYVIRPMGTSGTDWFFPVVGVVTVLGMLLLGAGARPGPRRRYAWAESRPSRPAPRPRRWR